MVHFMVDAVLSSEKNLDTVVNLPSNRLEKSRRINDNQTEIVYKGVSTTTTFHTILS